MHSAQRRAIVAIISVIETSLHQLKNLLLADDEPKTGQSHQANPELVPDGYLSEENEEAVERMIEAHRQNLQKEAEAMAQKAYSSKDYKGFFEGMNEE